MYLVILQWNTTHKSYFTTFIKVIKWQKPWSHISLPKKFISLSGKEKIVYVMYFTEIENRMQKVSSSFRLMQPIYLLKDSTKGNPHIPFPSQSDSSSGHSFPFHPSNFVALQSLLSTPQCTSECQKLKTKWRRGREYHIILKN